MADEIEDFIITGKEHRLYKKFQKHIESFYKVKINMPRVASSDSDIVFISMNGEESCRNGVKKFISDKMLNKNVQRDGDVLIVTLSDSGDDESSSSDEDVSETPSSKSTAASNLLLDESVLIIDKPVTSSIDTQKKTIETIEKSDVLGDSICVIESPRNLQQQNRTSFKKRKRRINCMKAIKKVRFNVNLYSDADASELHDIISIRDARARIEINICDETKTLPESSSGLQYSSDFIPVFDTGKNNFKRHKSAFNHQPRQSKIKEGEIIMIEPYSVNKNVSSHQSKLSSTQKEKNEEIVKIVKDITTYTLRPVVIDGSNVAREHGKVTNCFSAKGIQLAINYFLNRGHTMVTALLPKYRRLFNPKHSVPTMNPEIIEDLAKKQLVAFTPSRRMPNGKLICSYDDRFMVQLASKNGGVIVSNDNYRDLLEENVEFRETIENRLLMFFFVGDEFMVPEDPLGRDGPKLNEFLRMPCMENK